MEESGRAVNVTNLAQVAALGGLQNPSVWSRQTELVAMDATREGHPPEILWLLSGNRLLASSRLQGYVIDAALRRAGVRSRIAFQPPVAQVDDLPWGRAEIDTFARLASGRLTVVQKLKGLAATATVAAVRASGGVVVYVDCDHNPGNVVGLGCDLVACTSRPLADAYVARGAARVRVIDDPVEYVAAPSRLVSSPVGPLRVAWIGHRGNWDTLGPVRAALAQAGGPRWRLVTFSDHPDADIRWDFRAIRRAAATCQAAVVPTGTSARQGVKSNNRVTMFMAAGLPVVAGTISSYREVIRAGENGFHADTADEYAFALRTLEDPAVRSRVAAAGYRDAATRFAPDAVAARWRLILEEAWQARPATVPTPLGRLRRWLLWQQLAGRNDLADAGQLLDRGAGRAAATCFLRSAVRASLSPALARRQVGWLVRRLKGHSRW